MTRARMAGEASRAPTATLACLAHGDPRGSRASRDHLDGPAHPASGAVME